jgi:MoxR-like ATPase
MSVGELTENLRQGGYLADRGLATALFLSLSLSRPVLLEGEVGTGKTEVAKVLAAAPGRAADPAAVGGLPRLWPSDSIRMVGLFRLAR